MMWSKLSISGKVEATQSAVAAGELVAANVDE